MANPHSENHLQESRNLPNCGLKAVAEIWTSDFQAVV
jgi:hypothetical protein